MQRCSLLVCFFLALGASSWAQGDQRNTDEQDDFELVQMQRLKFDTSIADEEAWQLMAKGSGDCPDGLRIATKIECEKAHDALGLTRQGPTLTYHRTDIPSGCSTRQGGGHGLHWNEASEGQGRSDLTTICRKAPDKELSTATTGNKDKEYSDHGCGQPCDPGICYAFGDPHVYTFDGAGVVLNDKVMNIWLVHSDSVQIQAMLASRGFIQGLAFGGKWMKDHTLILSSKGVTFDGKLILLESEDTHIVSDLVELHRHATMSPPDKVINELDGKSNWWSDFRHRWYIWSNGQIKYHFKLPLDVELWISGPLNQQQVMIKMVRRNKQSGYCGNFNGDSEDDFKPGTKRDNGFGMSLAAGTMLDAIEESEDLFKKAHSSVGSSTLQTEKFTDSEVECSEDLMKKAKEACSHIPERLIHDSCVMDICLTKDLTVADQAMEMEMMNALHAQGSVELQGPGRCLDQDGAKYSTIEDVSISGKMECFKRLHELSHHAELVGKGVRGVQFKTGSCQILAENVTADLLEELPGQWQSQETYSGSGIVSDSDNVEGWTCWKII